MEGDAISSATDAGRDMDGYSTMASGGVVSEAGTGFGAAEHVMSHCQSTIILGNITGEWASYTSGGRGQRCVM